MEIPERFLLKERVNFPVKGYHINVVFFVDVWEAGLVLRSV